MTRALTRTQYYCAMSLDGFIAESDDTLEWLMKYEGSYEGEGTEPGGRGGYESFYEGVGALVMGSTTYEFVLEHEGSGGTWPYAGKPSWVLSSRELAQPWGDDVDIRIEGGPVATLYDDMIGAAGERHLWVVGGGNVASQFAEEGLLDELHVTVVPVVLGEGKPLFDRRVPGAPLQLTGTTVFDSGMVELRYELHDPRVLN